MGRQLPELVAAGTGIGLIAVAVVWWVMVRYRSRRRLMAMLTAGDPGVRRAAVELLGDGGLLPYASVLVGRTNVEHDAGVLDAIATLVARNQWEPADHRKLVELRLWARRHLAGADATLAVGDVAVASSSPSLPAAVSPLARQLEASLGEPVVSIHLEDVDGTVERYSA